MLQRFNLSALLPAKTRHYLYLIPVAAVVGAAVSAYRARDERSSFQSTGRLVLSGRLNFSEGNPVANDFMSVLGTQLEILTSEELRERAMIKLRLEQPNASLRPDLSARQVPRTTLFELTATSSAPTHVQRYVDLVMEEYIAMRREQRLVSSRSLMDQISSEIARLEKMLNEQEAEIFRFKQQNNIVFWEQQSTTAARFLSQLKNREASLRMQLQLADRLERESAKDALASRTTALEIGGEGEAARRRTLSGMAGPAAGGPLMTHKLRLREQEIELEALKRVYLPKHPKYQKLEGEIAKQRRLVELLEREDATGFATEVAGMRSELATIGESMGEWEKKVLESSQIEAEHQKLQSAITRTRELYQRLIASLQNIDFRKGVDDEVIQILKRASLAAEVKPNPMRSLQGGVMSGLLAGVGLLLLVIRVDRRAFAVSEVESLGLEVAAEVPVLRRVHRKGVEMARPSCPRHFAEAFRNLRASLALDGVASGENRVVIVCSSTPGEGKSTVTLNLAHAATEAGLKTLVIDGDVRRGSLGARLGLSDQTPGFADFFRQGGDWRAYVQRLPDLNFGIITRGTESHRIVDEMIHRIPKELTDETRREYDLVILDSAPIMPVRDTIPFLSRVDRVVFIVRLRRGSLAAAARALQVLKRSSRREPLLVVNGTKPSDGHYDYYDYSYSYARRN